MDGWWSIKAQMNCIPMSDAQFNGRKALATPALSIAATR
jgi:hypothetical protein